MRDWSRDRSSNSRSRNRSGSRTRSRRSRNLDYLMKLIPHRLRQALQRLRRKIREGIKIRIQQAVILI